MSIGKRLRYLRGSVRLPDYAERYGVSKSTLSRYEKGQNLPDAEFIAAVCDAHNICPGWLIADKCWKNKAPLQLDESAGAVAAADDFALLGFLRQYLLGLNTDLNALLVTRVQGDAMAPTLPAGSLAVIRRQECQRGDDGLYAIASAEKLGIRRLQWLVDGTLRVKTDNPGYEDQSLTAAQAGQLELVGRVIWTGQMQF
ncbi:MAG: XRE family transcriptional regulator [Desulfuromonas sp.]|jgi:transcriptional regulator with XRE-family HTH domain|nr:LexA family transcriptional regulator [Desulfuromonas thiophila]MDY0398478.1 LexA family transcriptional regulator [Desulfuromonas thiophila]